MTLKLNYEGFETNLVCQEHIRGGIHYVFKFGNQYGASVIKHYVSYGHEQDLWELAVIKFNYENAWHLNYDTEITDDVIGYLTDEEVRELLKKISELKDT